MSTTAHETPRSQCQQSAVLACALASLCRIHRPRLRRSALTGAAALLLALLAVSGPAQAQQESPELPPEIQERLDRLTAPPPSHRSIEVGGHLFRVPVDYIHRIRPGGGFFSMLFFRPGMIPYGYGLPDNYESNYRVLINEGSLQELEQIARSWQRRLQEGEEELLPKNPELPGLAIYGAPESQTRFLFTEEMGEISEQKILMFLCRPPRSSSHNLGTCDARFSPIPGIVVRIRFDRDLAR